jgi:hypothetical protein
MDSSILVFILFKPRQTKKKLAFQSYLLIRKRLDKSIHFKNLGRPTSVPLFQMTIVIHFSPLLSSACMMTKLWVCEPYHLVCSLPSPQHLPVEPKSKEPSNVYIQTKTTFLNLFLYSILGNCSLIRLFSCTKI